MKLWVCADTQTKFVCNVQPYLGKERPDAPPEKGQGERVVLDLVSKYRGRNVTCDNFFTTHSLATKLLQKNMTLVGTVNSKRTFLPVCDKKELKKRPCFHSKFYFDGKVSLVEYIPKKNKCVTVMSTLHHDKAISKRNQGTYASKDLPEMIHYYNQTKCGVDTVDQMIRTYTSKRKTNRWPVAFFENMLDISALNAYVLWLEINPDWEIKHTHKRRIYLEMLGQQLVRPMICERRRGSRSLSSLLYTQSVRNEEETSTSGMSSRSSPSSSRSPTPTSRSSTPEQTSPASKNGLLKVSKPTAQNQRGRCAFCPNYRKASYRCIECNKFLCGLHQNALFYCNEHIPSKN